MFLSREYELEQLDKEFCQPTSSFNILFGRRKIGKTALLNEYSKDKRTLYLSAVEMLPSLLFQNFMLLTSHFFNVKNNTTIHSLESFLFFLQEQTIEDKIVLIIDDFHHLLKVDKKALECLYTIWNKKLRFKNIQLIISSSWRSSDNNDEYIYKKATLCLILQSHSFSMIKKILPKLPAGELMYVYAAFGTNPQYLKLYDTKKDFILNVKEHLLCSNSFIFNEGMNLLKKDLSDVVTYASILYAIAMGNKKIGAIASFLNLKSTYLTRYMQKLVDMMIVTKKTPVNDNPLKSKFGRYEIEDNFVKFWFCYIYPNSSKLQSKEIYPVISHVRNDFSKRLVRNCYKQHVSTLIMNEPMKFLGYTPIHIGSWWNNKENEIDLVAYDSKNITFIDCKWREKHHLDESYRLLKAKAQFLETPLLKKYIIFSKNNINKTD